MTGIPDMNPDSVDAAVPWHYGDPFREQRALVDGRGVTDLSHYEVVVVGGQDRHSWLHSLTTQDFQTPFTSCQALILTPQGHIEYDLHVVDDGQKFWLILEPGQAEPLTTYLTSMKFLLDVDVQNVTNQYAVIGYAGHVTTKYPTWHSSPAFLTDAQVQDVYVPHRPASWKISQCVVPRAELADLLASSGGDLPDSLVLVGSWAWQAYRIRAGVPRFGVDTDSRTIPHEVGLICSAVHLQKGCYRGQETVAKVFNLGKPPRRLVQLLIDGSVNELPPPGTDVLWQGKVVGTLTSVVQDYELGPVGLALIKRNVALEDSLELAGIAANQEPIVVS